MVPYGGNPDGEMNKANIYSIGLGMFSIKVVKTYSGKWGGGIGVAPTVGFKNTGITSKLLNISVSWTWDVNYAK